MFICVLWIALYEENEAFAQDALRRERERLNARRAGASVPASRRTRLAGFLLPHPSSLLPPSCRVGVPNTALLTVSEPQELRGHIAKAPVTHHQGITVAQLAEE